MDRYSEPLRPGGYAAIDEDSPDQQALSVDMLDETNSWGTTQAVKAEIASQLRIQPGQSVLDAGCGTGDDCIALSEVVGDGGSVTGVDTSAVMMSEASARIKTTLENVRFQQADIQDLPFADSSFDSCRSEQTFQWLDDPDTALRELIRVTRSGGRIVIADTDYGGVFSLTADPDLTREVLWHSVTQMIPNPLIARWMPLKYSDVGLEDISVTPMFIGTNSQTTGLRREVITDITSFAVQSGQITGAEADRWAELAWVSHRNGTYWYGGLVLIVAGTKC